MVIFAAVSFMVCYRMLERGEMGMFAAVTVMVFHREGEREGNANVCYM